ncbi:MAG: RagB/SusD family nutrient uptake outer membrane protein [Bacteroides sp.]|nr:RagB/SusD family nutrient uptake outer membrane protein [Bacteroides sp.]MCM1457146.1 RagB/SusD family nutrient uptake outer membrane protein [Lachnoclostridium sp.]
MKFLKNIAVAAAAAVSLGACTDLDETLYDQVGSENYYNTKMDVIRATFRPFEHAFWSIGSRHVLNELTADQLITPTRDGWWYDGGKWERLHYHTWTVDDLGEAQTEWNGCFQGIMQCNLVIEDLEKFTPERFGFTQLEFDNLKAQCRALRAWFYIRLLDAFRNVPLVTTYSDMPNNPQAAPKDVFTFIETELKDCTGLLIKKTGLGTNSSIQGQWTQAAAASLLVRLYLNAEVYVGEDHYADCAAVAQDILDGVYGDYAVADRWDAAFDWDNDNCDEVIFGFPASKGYTHWQYDGDTYGWTVPAKAADFFNDTKSGVGHNTKYAASPSYDLDGNLYEYELGMPVQNFRKYPGDERMKLYANLGKSRREGMFLFGYLEYKDKETGATKRLRAPEQPYDLYIRDAVGKFQSMAPDKWPSDKDSKLMNGDHNSGWHFVKYPFYDDNDENQLESDYTEIRLPEIIYSLAECKLRAGDRNGAAKLLNSVRKRNYPADALDDVLYSPEGKVRFDEAEMLAEWGREFFAESRRRIDLVRFGKFNTGRWWDKNPDADNHTAIFPITRTILNSNPILVQNPGYGR